MRVYDIHEHENGLVIGLSSGRFGSLKHALGHSKIISTGCKV